MPNSSNPVETALAGLLYAVLSRSPGLRAYARGARLGRGLAQRVRLWSFNDNCIAFGVCRITMTV